MPPKITSKNLSYTSAPPPFLAALQAQAAGQRNSSTPDPIIAGRKRAVKKRSASEEAEDKPLVLDEDGNEVDVEVGYDGDVTEGTETSQLGNQENATESSDTGEVDKKGKGDAGGEGNIGIGGRKRRVGKVVGEEEEKPEEGQKGENEAKDTKGVKKKKTKKIKLSFDDEEG